MGVRTAKIVADLRKTGHFNKVLRDAVAMYKAQAEEATRLREAGEPALAEYRELRHLLLGAAVEMPVELEGDALARLTVLLDLVGAMAGDRDRHRDALEIAESERDRLAEKLDRSMVLHVQAIDRAEEAEHQLGRLRDACAKQDGEISQILGRALGYPRYVDDQEHFPDAAEADGVCVGEHVAETLAEEAARRIARLRVACESALAYDAAIQRVAQEPVVQTEHRRTDQGVFVIDRDDLDALYEEWIGKAREALGVRETKEPAP